MAWPIYGRGFHRQERRHGVRTPPTSSIHAGMRIVHVAPGAVQADRPGRGPMSGWLRPSHAASLSMSTAPMTGSCGAASPTTSSRRAARSSAPRAGSWPGSAADATVRLWDVDTGDAALRASPARRSGIARTALGFRLPLHADRLLARGPAHPRQARAVRPRALRRVRAPRLLRANGWSRPAPSRQPSSRLASFMATPSEPSTLIWPSV